MEEALPEHTFEPRRLGADSGIYWPERIKNWQIFVISSNKTADHALSIFFTSLVATDQRKTRKASLMAKGLRPTNQLIGVFCLSRTL